MAHEPSVYIGEIMSLFAANTTVPIERSRAAIEALLRKHKAGQYGTAVDHVTGQARVQFRLNERIVRFVISLPDPKKFRTLQGVEQAERQRWRALLLVIKAKLESVENNIASFEEEFLAHIVLPNDRTVADYVVPQIAEMYKAGKMLQLTSGGSK
jgi:hypothetical protein